MSREVVVWCSEILRWILPVGSGRRSEARRRNVSSASVLHLVANEPHSEGDVGRRRHTARSANRCSNRHRVDARATASRVLFWLDAKLVVTKVLLNQGSGVGLGGGDELNEAKHVDGVAGVDFSDDVGVDNRPESLE